MNPRGYAAPELRKLAEHALADAEMESVTLYKLLRVFERLVSRFEEDKKAKRCIRCTISTTPFRINANIL